MDADALCTTPAEHAALQALRAAAGFRSPMEAHCLRQFRIAERLAGDEPVDRELLLCACWLHDAGLWSTGPHSYVAEGALLAERVLGRFGWSPERLRRCMDACEHHHALRSRRHLGLEVELVRRSDLVDASGFLVTFGLDRRWLRSLEAQAPRRGFYPLIARAVLGELRTRPGTLADVFRL